MAQLDLSLFFYSWYFTLLSFLVLYLVLSIFVLPNLVIILKTRKLLL